MRFISGLALGGLLVVGCGDAGSIRADRDGAIPDGGILGDAAGADASTDAPPGSPGDFAVPATDQSLGFADEDPSRGFEGDDGDPLLRASCYDGEDNDGAGGTDCEDAACRDLKSCCVGDGDCCSASSIADVPSHVDLITCSSFDDCFGADRWTFVGTAASLSPEGMSPEGSATGEGGIALLTPIDVSTHRLALTLDITPPDDCASMGCVESLGVGLVDQPPALGEGVTIEPPIAVVYSGARDAVSVMREGTELARLERLDATSISLVARSTGEITVEVGTQSFGLSDAFDPRALHVVLYGRTRNPGASDMRATTLRSLDIATELCDIPSAWGVREPLGIDAGQPSIARDGDITRIAYVDVEGRIAIAEQREGSWVELPGRIAHADLVGVKRIGDPELVVDDASWVVYFTAENDDGSTQIWRAVHAGEAFELDSAGLLGGAWAPTLASSTLGVTIMVVQSEDGLVAYRRGTEETWSRLDFSMLASVTRSIGGEIGSASLVQHNNAWHLYVAVRRGARWSVHLLASDEMLAWRHVGRALAPSIDFDRVSVRAPDVWAEGNLLRMVYEAEDGVDRTVAMTSRLSTRAGTF